MIPRQLPRPRVPPILSPDDDFFADVSDERIPVPRAPVPVMVVSRTPDEPPPGPAPYFDVGFGMDETTVLGPPSVHTARGWAYRADKILAPPGKTLRDEEGRMVFTRSEFLRFTTNILRTLAAYELQVDPSRIPWGVFRNEEETFDREADWERLRAWIEEQ